MIANDVLPAFFLADDPDEVLAAAAALATLSHGHIRLPDGLNRRTGKPERFGLFCARTFGPVDDGRCLCGKYAAPEHHGRVCEKCGVLCGPSTVRGERWGHLESPVGLLHPRLAPRIARHLGCTPAELARVVAYAGQLHPDGRVSPGSVDSENRGPDHVADRLGEHATLLLKHVPVVPPAWRGTRRDPQDDAYARLINRCNRLTRLLELNAPEIILDNEKLMTQQAFDRLYEAVRRELAARAPIVVATATPHAQRLLQAVYDDPDSDPARRAYATHLQREGDLRGEFILSMLASPARTRLSDRESDLLRRDFERYLAPLAGLVDPAVTFRRGFIAGCKTTFSADNRLDEPGWSTVEHLETDNHLLVRSDVMRSLVSLALHVNALASLHAAAAVLPRVHTLQLTLPRCPPPQADALRDCHVLPGLRDLTVVHKSTRGPSDFRWLAASPLVHDLERLTVVLALDRLPALALPFWLEFLAARPHLTRVSLTLGKNMLTCELRRDREWIKLRVVASRSFVERVCISDAALGEHLVTALTALGPHDVMDPRVESRGSWFGDELASVAARLQDHFGGLISLPRIA